MYIIAIYFIFDLTIIAIIVIITIIHNVDDCRFCVFRQAAISYFSGGIDMHESYCNLKIVTDTMWQRIHF